LSADNFVREARAADAADLARIQVESWQAAYAGLVPEPVLAELTSADAEEHWRSQWEAAAGNPPTGRHRVLVAVETRAVRPSEPDSEAGDGTGTSREQRQRVVAGFASCGPATDADRWPATDAEMYELDVAPEMAGRGHGSRLLNAVADTVRDDGFHTLCAWALESGSGIRRFLEASGWRADGARAALDMGIAVPVIRLHVAVGAAA
jgi:GNAT superfamily N-acetyltransferase